MICLNVDESRRLTGPNLFIDAPGAVMEVYISDVESSQVIALWEKYLKQILASLGLTAELFHRNYDGGVNLGFSADEDMLYTACEINEAALELAGNELSAETTDQALNPINNLKQLLLEERNPSLLALIHAAKSHQVTCLVDDDEISLGMGKSCQCWPISQIPELSSICWKDYHDIPVALVTGTNGKSTSVRMCDAIVAASGVSAGSTSTDYIKANHTIIDKGDYSGPIGARTLIRDHRVELALLEVARGGMLRRGLGTNKAKAALITNVADDHLGQYGITTVEELIAVKAIVARSLTEDGTLVVNADDPGLVDYFEKNPQLIRGKICWFSLNSTNEKVLKQKQLQQSALWLEDGKIILSDAGQSTTLIAVNDIPTTKNGAARHNIPNSMGAAAVCYVLGIGVEAIASGLKNFRGDNSDNPGRGNYFTINGATVLIDFAHNAHSLSAVIETVSAIPAKRRLIMLGHAGDRTDRDIINLTDVASSLKPDVVITAEIPDYLRGRDLGTIPLIIRERCLAKGFKDEQIIYAKDCLDGAKIALKWATPGDFILLLALDQRDDIFQYLGSLG